MNIETINRLEEIKPVFLFIPDISGFTKFINDTNLYASKRLVHDLLETIVDSNILNMKVAEILGDAIVFYSVGTPPSILKIECQAKKTFQDFQKAIQRLSHENGWKKQITRLTLKIVVHYGQIATTEIKGINKLIGSDLILAYRVLKNSIREHEYLLMTEGYLKTQKQDLLKKSFAWSDIISGEDLYDSFGIVSYKYVPLTPLRNPVRAL